MSGLLLIVVFALIYLGMNGAGTLFLNIFVYKPRKNTDTNAFFYSHREELVNVYQPVIEGKIPYFDQLPGNLKLKFLSRIPYFLRDKTFIGKEGLEVTFEMKVLIASSAIQLTLGLENFIFEKFHTIIIYPQKYYSKITELFHIGEARPGGCLVFSWADFLKGYEIGHDTYNVGLHEMAHALELDTRSGNLYDDAFGANYDRWQKLSRFEYNNMQDDSDHFLREYAGTNLAEFFAVCVEHFFEASEEFKKEMPELYELLAHLLNQDPAVGVVGK